MANSIDPTPFIGITPHGNQRGDLPRVRLQGGPFVDAHVHNLIYEWKRRGVAVGLIVDRLVWHAMASGFDPISNSTPPLIIPKLPTKKKPQAR